MEEADRRDVSDFRACGIEQEAERSKSAIHEMRMNAEATTVPITVRVDGTAVIAPEDTRLEYTAAEWDAFMKGVADGQFTRP